jgi:hypothetical protein
MFQVFMNTALDMAVAGKTIDFVFDRQDVLRARTVQTFDEMYAGEHLPPHRLGKVGTISHADSGMEVPLQAADLCAYFWNRVLSNSLRGDLLEIARCGMRVKKARLKFFGQKELQAVLQDEKQDAMANVLRMLESALGDSGSVEP